MAIKVGGTTVIDDSLRMKDILSLDFNNVTLSVSPVGITHNISSIIGMPSAMGGGVVTLDPRTYGNFCAFQNNGDFEFAASIGNGRYHMVIYLVNSASAGTVTFTGFDNVVGDALTTINGDKFILYLCKPTVNRWLISIVSLQ